MTRNVLWALLALLPALPAGAQTLNVLGAASASSKGAAARTDDAGAKAQAAAVFDRSATGGTVSPPPVLVPLHSDRKITGDLVVGTPGKHQLSEPPNPLTADGKAVEQKSGHRLWWGLGGALVGAGVGFLIGGPIGAAVGALALGILGFIFGP